MTPRESPQETLDVTVLLMCRNEEKALSYVIKDIRAAFQSKKYSYEILVVDDGSTDQSANIARGLSCRVISHAQTRGAGAACKTGVLASKGNIVVMLDADGTYTAADIPLMLEFFPQVDQVNGARTSEQGYLPLLRVPAKWVVRMFASLLVNRLIPDLQTGLKAFKKDLILPYLWMIPDKFSYATLMTIIFLCKGYAVTYIPTQYHKRIGSSKYRPFRDTLYVVKNIIKVVVYFKPLRFFMFLSVLLLWAGFLTENFSHNLLSIFFNLCSISAVIQGLWAEFLVFQRSKSFQKQ